MEVELSPEVLGVTADLAALSVDARLGWSATLLFGVLLLRWILLRVVRRDTAIVSDRQRRWMLAIRNVASFVAIVGLTFLWASELEDFILSIAAFSVAIVIASKEVVMCLAGGFLRQASGAFTAGDWIEVGPHSGEVVEILATSTQLQEFDRVGFEHTGRLITVPNSLFLSSPVINHSFRKRFIFHEFAITAEPHPDVAGGREAILATLAEELAPVEDVALRYHAMVERRTGIKLPAAGAEVRIRTTDFAKIRYEIRLFCPRERAAALEQSVMRAWLAHVDAAPWRFVGTQAPPD